MRYKTLISCTYLTLIYKELKNKKDISMDEIDISKGQSLGTFLVLFFLLDNGFFCKKNEKGNRDQRVASPKGDSHNGPKSHTHKRSRGAVYV